MAVQLAAIVLAFLGAKDVLTLRMAESEMHPATDSRVLVQTPAAPNFQISNYSVPQLESIAHCD